MEKKLQNINKNKIHVTSDYSKFSYLVGNRDIVNKHVKIFQVISMKGI